MSSAEGVEASGVQDMAHGGDGAGGARPRLVMKEMVLENFKSYGGVQRVGPFHHNFSSVVGPNGSGKSNVIDALLFVFGKRASQLRLNKVKELIHNSSSFKNLKHTRVDVYFHEIVDLIPGQTFEVVPGTDLKISRAAYHDDRSEYYVNDKRSSFGDVAKILKGKGVDLDNNRFLILQGEVEQISLMPPKGEKKGETGLLEYLEDIIGTHHYVEQIDSLADELSVMNEQRSGLIQRVKVAQKDKDSLEGSKQEAEQYLHKERELLRAKVFGYHCLLREHEGKVAAAEEGRAAALQRKAEEEEKTAQIRSEVEECERECREKREQHEAVKKELGGVKTEMKQKERKDVKIKEDFKHLKQKKKKMAEKLKKGEANKAKLQSEIDEITAKLPELEAEVAKCQASLETESAKLAKMQGGFKGEYQGLREQLEKVNLDLAPWEQQIKEVEGEVEVASAELKLITKKAEGAQQRLEETREGIVGAEKVHKDKTAEVTKCEKSLVLARRELESAAKESGKVEKEFASANSALQAVRGKVEERKAALSSEQSQGQVVRSLMAAQNAGKLSGIYGRLGDLGATESKFDVAISTACPGLDNIVVRTISDAQNCVKFLKQNELGRATFLILEKQSGLRQRMEANAKVPAPGGAPRLLDLIKLKDPELKVAFYFALRDTVLANDLAHAQQIAYGHKSRWRVVTLRGQVIEQSGTMSGGGKPRHGRILVGKASSISSNGEDLRKAVSEAQGEYDQVHSSFEKIKQRKDAAQKVIQLARDSISRLEMEIPKCRMEADSAKKQAEECRARLTSLEGEAKVSSGESKRLSELQAAISQGNEKLEGLNANTAALRGRADELNQAIEDVGGAPMKKLREAVAQAEKAIEDKAEQISKMQVQSASNTKLLAKTEKEVAKATSETDSVAQEIAAMKEQSDQLEEESFKVMQSVTKAEELCQQKLEEVKTAEKARSKLQKVLQGTKKDAVDIDNDVEKAGDNLKEAKRDRKEVQKELDKARKAARSKFEDFDMPGTPTEEEMADADLEEVQRQAKALQAALDGMNVDMNAIEEYAEKERDHARKMQDLDSATSSRDQLRGKYDDLRKKRLDDFMAGFNVIALKLKEMYQMITLGGDAELELVDSLDPFIEGIVFSVRPPKKSWKNIRNLSGGEKTLSSLALVFALHHYKPTPLYVMDEIDAALDFRNVSIVAHYIKERTKNAQFVIISLRNNMFELADRLVGIYKTHNTTKSVTIDPDLFQVGGKTVSVT